MWVQSRFDCSKLFLSIGVEAGIADDTEPFSDHWSIDSILVYSLSLAIKINSSLNLSNFWGLVRSDPAVSTRFTFSYPVLFNSFPGLSNIAFSRTLNVFDGCWLSSDLVSSPRFNATDMKM